MQCLLGVELDSFPGSTAQRCCSFALWKVSIIDSPRSQEMNIPGLG